MTRTKGFTLVELLLAMAFFSFILSFVVAGFVQINRAYTNGLTVRRVQEGARAVIEDLTRVMRTASSVNQILDGPSDGVYRICFGNVRIGWNQYDGTGAFTTEDFEGEQINYIKSFDGNPTCDAPFVENGTNSSPLDEQVKIQYLGITPVQPIELKTYVIKVVVSSLDDSDLQTLGENASCRVQVGDQFCDVAVLETVVSLRN